MKKPNREKVNNMKMLWLDTKDTDKAFNLLDMTGYDAYHEEFKAFVEDHTKSQKEEPDIIESLRPLMFGFVTSLSNYLRDEKTVAEKEEEVSNKFFEQMLSQVAGRIPSIEAQKMGIKSVYLARAFLKGRAFAIEKEDDPIDDFNKYMRNLISDYDETTKDDE